jgi:chemotaxis protein histidine kinase CheA
MKKRLEAELISIAHRILKLKNKSEVDQLYKETQKLYETLSVLKFYQDNFEAVKSDVSKDVLEERLESNVVELSPEPAVEVKDDVVEAVAEAGEETTEETEEVQAESQEPIEEPKAEEAEEAAEETEVSEEPESTEEKEEEKEEPVTEEKPSFEPIFGLEAEEEEEEEEEIIPAEVAPGIPEEKLEDHIGKYADPIFVKPDEVSLFATEIPAETREEIKAAIPAEEPKATPNEALSKSIAIGLNDRIGFVQHLFNDSNEDFNRVISQLNTFDTFEEAKAFINEMVIPDYNYWVGEEEYIERFMAIVEKKFE